MLWIFVVSSASSKVSGGRIVASRFASMDFPVPGGPMSRIVYQNLLFMSTDLF
jgi:hypothetical protein